MVRTTIEGRKNDRETMLGSDRLRKKEERQSTEQQRLVQTALERRKKGKATMIVLDRIRMKEERQSNNAWFGPP